MAYHVALLSGKRRSKYNKVKKSSQSKQNKILELRMKLAEKKRRGG